MSRSKIRIGVLGVAADVVRGSLFQDNAKKASEFLGQQIEIFPITKDHISIDAVLFSDSCHFNKLKKCPSEILQIHGQSSKDIYKQVYKAILKISQDYLLDTLA